MLKCDVINADDFQPVCLHSEMLLRVSFYGSALVCNKSEPPIQYPITTCFSLLPINVLKYSDRKQLSGVRAYFS